jgi:hypothetical protein
LLGKLTILGKTLILCFDGLDELPEDHQRKLLRNISRLSGLPGIKLLLMSRSNIKLGSLPHKELRVSAHESDLRNVLSSKFNEIYFDMV